MNKTYRIAGVLIAFSMFAPALAAAQQVSITGSSTVDAQVQSLLSEINSLQQQLKSLVQSVVSTSTPRILPATSTAPSWQGTSTPPIVQGAQYSICPSFGRDLSEGSQGSDVSQLQQLLSSDGFFSASSTGFFGPLTAKALAAFQVHAGIAASSSASGFFGALTRNFFSAHCGGPNNANGTSTPPSQHPLIPVSTSTPFWGGPGPVIIGSTTTGVFHAPVGSSTPPRSPCPQSDTNADQGAAAALFVPHAILPPNPCQKPNGDATSSSQ